MFYGTSPFLIKKIQEMKKLFFMFAVAALVLTAMTGCKKKGVQSVRALVKHVQIDNRKLLSLTVNVGENSDSMIFSLNDARIQQGVMMPGDSVIVDYVEGRNDTLRAVVVTLLPKIVIPTDEPGTSDSLLVAPDKKTPNAAPAQ